MTDLAADLSMTHAGNEAFARPAADQRNSDCLAGTRGARNGG
jgi:hypothetical protein